MKNLEIGKCRIHEYEPFNIEKNGILKSADICIYEKDMPGWVEAVRREPKSGIWPFRKGKYDVSVTTLLGDWHLSDGAGQIETPLIQNERFRSAKVAVKEGIKAAIAKKDNLAMLWRNNT